MFKQSNIAWCACPPLCRSCTAQLRGVWARTAALSARLVEAAASSSPSSSSTGGWSPSDSAAAWAECDGIAKQLVACEEGAQREAARLAEVLLPARGEAVQELAQMIKVSCRMATSGLGRRGSLSSTSAHLKTCADSRRCCCSALLEAPVASGL